MQESSRKARDFVDDSAESVRVRARFPAEVVPLIIICRSDRRDRIVHSINHDTANRDKAERKRSRRANFLRNLFARIISNHPSVVAVLPTKSASLFAFF